MPFNLKLKIEAITRNQIINNGYREAVRIPSCSIEERIGMLYYINRYKNRYKNIDL